MIGRPLLLAAVLAQSFPANFVAPTLNRGAAYISTPRALDRWGALIAEASARFCVPEGWIRAVIQAESDGRTSLDGRLITSSAGAMGLMQLMPRTWRDLRERYHLGPDPYAPRDNILAGAGYLRILYTRYGFPYLFAAYNAGPKRVDSYLLAGTPLPAETRAYLSALGQPSSKREISSALSSVNLDRLFFPLGADHSVEEAPSQDRSGDLSAPP